jgi:aminomethyltransferase
MALVFAGGRAIGTWFVARTGYTGEDGFEIMLPVAEAGGILVALMPGACAPAGSVRATRCGSKPA